MESEQAWKVSIEQLKAAGYNLDQKNPNAVADEIHDPDVLLARYASLQTEADSLRLQLQDILAKSLTNSAGSRQ